MTWEHCSTALPTPTGRLWARLWSSGFQRRILWRSAWRTRCGRTPWRTRSGCCGGRCPGSRPLRRAAPFFCRPFLSGSGHRSSCCGWRRSTPRFPPFSVDSSCPSFSWRTAGPILQPSAPSAGRRSTSICRCLSLRP